MKVTILCVGKPLPVTLQPIAAEYEQRLRPYAQIEWVYIKPSQKPPDEARREESALLLDKVNDTDTLLVLDERGVEQTNQQFGRTYSSLESRHGRLVIAIGGAYGFDDSVRRQAAFVWSLSALVFPHRLVRIIVLEQLYRTYMLNQGHPYHHE